MGILSGTSKLVDEKVYSPVNDVDIKKHLNESPIWKLCYKHEDITKEVRSKHNVIYEYSIKFDGVKPVQFTGVKVYSGK